METKHKIPEIDSFWPIYLSFLHMQLKNNGISLVSAPEDSWSFQRLFMANGRERL